MAHALALPGSHFLDGEVCCLSVLRFLVSIFDLAAEADNVVVSSESLRSRLKSTLPTSSTSFASWCKTL